MLSYLIAVIMCVCVCVCVCVCACVYARARVCTCTCVCSCVIYSTFFETPHSPTGTELIVPSLSLFKSP